MNLSMISGIAQLAVTILVSGIMFELARITGAQFMRNWSRAWIALSISLASAVTSILIGHFFGGNTFLQPFFLMIYCGCEYVFGFLLWMGCKRHQTGNGVNVFERAYLIATMGLAIILPLLLRSIDELFPIHSAVIFSYFAISFWTFWRSNGFDSPSLGKRLIRISLFLLTLIFLHYTIVINLAKYRWNIPSLTYMHFSSLYDAGLEICLAMGMILLATERFRKELEDRNKQLAEASEELAQAARTDPLTGLLNRRAFDFLPSEINSSSKNGVIAMIDVNDLKPINDIYGHQVGDVVLQIVARCLRIHFRVTDPIYRLGGDEFAVAMPDCTEEDMVQRLNDIDKRILNQRIPGLQEPIDIRISWGVMEYGTPEKIAAAVSEADVLMYNQKKYRKNGNDSRSSSKLSL